MDRITSALLAEFSRESGLEGLEDNVRFEHFAASVAMSPYLIDTFDTSDVVVGSGNDTGIDAIAVVINGQLVADPELVAQIAQSSPYLDVEFLFLQAERSSSFDGSKIGTFGAGVVDFFSDVPRLPRNTGVAAAAEVMSAVYEHSARFVRGNPVCRLYYVTTGAWVDDQNLLARRGIVESDLAELQLFREVDFLCLGAREVQKLYNQSRNAIARDITFADKTVLPEMPGVSEAYLGLLPAPEFISLLRDDSGLLIRTIFNDNVRDWQDYNAVNAEMRETLMSPDQRRRFALMNNGVTIIAKTLRATGNRFHIEDYQVVNGCQTSHVLYDLREELDDTVMVPVRLISTQDEEVIGGIVKATNRQTQVKEEQLLALNDYQKKLEAYFNTHDSPTRLYYERRSRQFDADSSVEKTRIITVTNMIRAYASIFLEEPHRTTRDYRALLEKVGTEIFGPDHRPEMYYYAASALYRLEFLFRNGSIDSKLKPARYHILLAARYLASSAGTPRPNSHEAARLADELANQIWDPEEFEGLFQEAVTLVERVADGDLHRDNIRTQPFTERVIAECKRISAPTKS